MRIMLIANPKAGRFKRVSIDSIKEYLEGRGAKVTLFVTAKRGDAERFALDASSSEYDVVVAAGGDGTLNEVINGLAGNRSTGKKNGLGIIPAGTVNVFALECGIPFDPYKACDEILGGSAVEVNIGSVGDRRFILMASAGFDAHVAEKINEGLKSIAGKLAYVLHGIYLLLFYKFPKIKITADGREYSGYTVIISNMSFYAGSIQITPGASFLSDDFEVCIVTKKGIIAVIKFFIYLLFKKHKLLKELTFIKAKELSLESNFPCSVQADGDGIGSLPVKVCIVKNALSVILPDKTG